MDPTELRRITIATLFVEFTQPVGLGESLNERLVFFAVALSSRAVQPFSLSKIAQITGVPRTTARRALESCEQRGWIQRRQDNTFVIDPACPWQDDFLALLSRRVQESAAVLAEIDRT